MSEGELRAMVREVLRDALAGRRDNGVPAAEPGPPSTSDGTGRMSQIEPGMTETVRVATDSDLAAFVARLAGLMADPAKAAAIRAGKHRFKLAGGVAPARPSAPQAPAPAVTTLSGTITEKTITGLSGGTTIRLAPGAVMTPLARDRVRSMGLKIERRR